MCQCGNRAYGLAAFGTTDVVGKEYQSNFFPTKVVGVVKDVNAIFQTAYADAFVPFSLENEDYYATWTGAWEESVWDCSNCCRTLVLQRYGLKYSIGRIV